ncbi:DUF6519 domain-containing protein [Phytohabitans rumicis]|uniref:Uncharacterized protein n=1 Tax=Phytohabitans rumicis TaxID=1076125 RepID=A0A6V8LDJ6_9ACTN|nr:DUF6519 domain-containing protein [Phytohabitans rumicis]GFJ92659.1 hypothetical protein Prum_063010 [Phytohabitans rumicis]
MTGGDITRVTFDPTRHFSGVRMQQGRVQLDADWNEQVDIAAYHGRTTARDVIGPTGAPKQSGGFRLQATADGTDLTIGAGRMYVAGVLCETESGSTATRDLTDSGVRVESLVLDGRELAVHDWVELRGTGAPALARLSTVDVADSRLGFADDIDAGALAGTVRLRRVRTYTTQPDLPRPELTEQANSAAPRVLDLPDGAYLAYLDAWERPVTALEQPSIREVALGGPDTATRTQIVAQVRLAALAAAPDPLDPAADIPEWTVLTAAPDGRMAAFAEAEDPATTPCVLPETAGFQGLENQLYRVQIVSATSLLWSRENASVTASWTQRNGAELTLGSAAPDRALGFAADGWIELTDDTHQLRGATGTLVQLTKVEGTLLTVRESTATGPLDLAAFPVRPRVRRWDSPGPVPLTRDTDIELEDGVQVRFPSGGSYRAGDHWLIPARTGTANVEWPRDSAGRPLAVRPHGIRHWHARLALVVSAGGTLTVTDWRTPFPALTELTAADVAYDNSQCALVDTGTVQEALDRLCQERDLRFHNRHLHGWGIVNGLALRCGPNPAGDPRHIVTVEPGYAIDAEGEDRLLDAPGIEVDVATEIQRLRDRGIEVLDEDGDGELCLRLGLDSQGGTAIVAEKRAPVPEEDASLLAGTLWADFWADCIGPVSDFLRRELADDPDRPAGPAQERRAALVNLSNQAVNPKTGHQVFISEREDVIIRGFYTGLRALLRSETFCAMFENARPVPVYPLEDLGMDTIFGRGGHNRLRLHPSGDQAWTFGAGVNPVGPKPFINRYDLNRQVLVAEIDPVAGAQRTGGPKLSANADTGTGAVLDVAISPDGRRIFVAIASRTEDNTIFRSGSIRPTGVGWAPPVTICGIKLVSLATTAADNANVYAVALKKVQIQTPDKNGGTTTSFQWRSAGLRGINPDQIDPNNVPEVPLTPEFAPTGPMTIDTSGRAVLAGRVPETDATTYAKLLQINLPGRQVRWTVDLPASGTDGLSFARAGRTAAVYAVVKPGADKAIVGFALSNGAALTPDPIEVTNTGIGLAGAGTQLLVTESANNIVRMVDPSADAFVPTWGLPTQVQPTAVAVTTGGRAVVLNQVSDTLTIVDAELLSPTFVFPSAELVAYRTAMLNAFADLTGGFLQYVKDCLFDHFLVRAPQPTGAEKLWLGCVSIRANQVYKVCNFSGRKYVKSFPTVGYWLSLVPLQPLIARAVEWLGCLVLPEHFGKYSADPDDDADDLLPLGSLLDLVDWAQGRTSWASSTTCAAGPRSPPARRCPRSARSPRRSRRRAGRVSRRPLWSVSPPPTWRRSCASGA